MVTLWIVLGVLALCALAGVAGALIERGGAPQYRVVSDTDGKIVVEVDGANQLRAVFDDVRSGHKAEGGYFVSINCSSGATAGADNRLANGKFAVGALGSAKTGLPAGGAEFDMVPGGKCP